MNKLSTAKRAAVVSALVEGNSIRSTSRMTGVSKPTVLKLLADLGRVCAAYHDEFVWNLQTKRVQCDEIWSFCYAKAKNVPESFRYEVGGAGREGRAFRLAPALHGSTVRVGLVNPSATLIQVDSSANGAHCHEDQG